MPQGSEAYNHRYSEADITWLESQDLTNPTVVTALRTAYRQNDPEERDFVGFRRGAHGYGWGTVRELTRRVEEAEAALRARPCDFDARMKRLMAMIGLARHAKRTSDVAAATA